LSKNSPKGETNPPDMRRRRKLYANFRPYLTTAICALDQELHSSMATKNQYEDETPDPVPLGIDGIATRTFKIY